MVSVIGALETIAIIGFLLALYSKYVERKFEASRGKYKALCDINKKVSCTKAFSSNYGKTFGISNSVWGMYFYAVVFVLSLLGYLQFIFYLAILSVIGSAYLAYILVTKVKSFCIICTGTYIVNVLLLIFSYVEIYG